MSTSDAFRNKIKPNWCPGCGHYALQHTLQQAVANRGLKPHQLAVVSGIGCSGRISGYLYSYGFHGIHGRALPVAQGLKMANPDLQVIACGGDGDGFAIGMGHTVHAMKRNMDITYIVLDNHVYGLTKGQTSPRSDQGFKTKSTPQGSTETPLSALELALVSGATFVAQSFSQNTKELTTLIEKGMAHKGFSFINMLSPCVTFNKINTYEWYKKHLISLVELEGYDPGDRLGAMKMVMEQEGLVTGLIYENTEKLSYQEGMGKNPQPLVTGDSPLGKEVFQVLMAEFM